MLVTRKVICTTEDFRVGDQIEVELNGFGKFTLTAQKVTNDGTLFIFDSIVTRREMNKEWTNKGGFKKSDLNKWMQTELLNAFPEDIKRRMKSISIPTYGQMFGHDDFYENFEPDNDEQFELMKNPKNRVAVYEDYTCWYWLQNATKKSVSATYFAVVLPYGNTSSDRAGYSVGVLPVILLA